MSYNYCKDHRSGITYVYDVTAFTDENGKRKSTRKLVGKLDEDNNIVPTSGRRGRLPKNRNVQDINAATDSGMQEQLESFRRQVLELQEMVRTLREEKRVLVEGMQKLLEQVL